MLGLFFAHLRRQWMGALALFLVLTGGSAYALSGSNTVFTDDIANDTFNSPTQGQGGLVAADLRPNSVGTSEVALNSLTGSDINEATLTGDAQKLIYVDSSASGIPKTIATVGPYTVKGQCVNPSVLTTNVRIIVRGPAGTANSTWSQTRNDNSDEGNHSTGFVVPANTDTQIIDIAAASGDFTRGGGTSMLRVDGGALVQVDFNAVADFRNNQTSCFIYGTAMRAT
jgi:hypothetical protein